MQDGKVIVVVGGKGTGKTTWLRNAVKPVHPDALLIHDVGNNFRDIYNKPQIPFKDFNRVCTQVSNCVVIYEEASIFVRHTAPTDLTDFLVGARQRCNTVYLVFHSHRLVPYHVLDLTDILIIKKTKDKISVVESKYEDDEITERFKRVMASPDKFAFEIHNY